MSIAEMKKWAILAGVAGVALYVAKKGGIAGAVAGASEAIAATAAGAATGLATGTIVGIGQVVGVPATSRSTCEAAIMAADNLKASKYCSAGVFAKWQLLSARKKLTGRDFTMADIFN